MGQAEAKAEGSRQQMSVPPRSLFGLFSKGQQQVEKENEEKGVKAVNFGDDGLRPEGWCHGKGGGSQSRQQALSHRRQVWTCLPQ
jgi:hypothetical protein